MTALSVIAKIDESRCIGCTKCIDACPVDAIIGASKQLHTVIEQDCIGCKLCLPPCPTRCIELVPLTISAIEQRERAQRGKELSKRRKERLKRHENEKGMVDKSITTLDIKSMIAASIARNQIKRQGSEAPHE